MLKIKRDNNNLVVTYNDSLLTILNSNSPINKQVNTIYYLLGSINPSVPRDMIIYELEGVLNG